MKRERGEGEREKKKKEREKKKKKKKKNRASHLVQGFVSKPELEHFQVFDVPVGIVSRLLRRQQLLREHEPWLVNWLIG